MEITELEIYPYIERDMDQISQVELKAEEYLCRAGQPGGGLYYVISGQMRVEGISPDGKKILVDWVGEDNFTGNISHVQKAYFGCDIVASTNCKLFFLEKSYFEHLMERKDFSELFFRKISSRIYQMYKKKLARSFYSLSELVAYHICQHTDEDGIFEYKSTYRLCEELEISRRGLYNILNAFLKEGYLERREGMYFILDRAGLEDLSQEIKWYMEEHEL